MTKHPLPKYLAIAALSSCALQAQAELVETSFNLPVTVADSYGKQVTREIVVTLFFDDTAPKPYPALVINHGRAADAGERKAMGRARYPEASRWFARMGFMVAVPTRVGYGVTGGEDVEDSGTCQRKNYPPAYAASADQAQQVLASLRQRPEVASDRAVVLGQSFGGATAIALTARNPKGVQAAINFAGGGGGNPKTHAQAPCAEQQLKSLFAGYGKTSRIPTLWVYTENDQWMGPQYPKAWFDAFVSEGGVGEFMLFPAFGDDGHKLFAKAAELWQPKVLEFLQSHGYPTLRATNVSP